MSKTADHMKSQVIALAEMVREGDYGMARPWGGAGVCIRRKPPSTEGSSWGSEPLYVITKRTQELSWLFERLVKVFKQLDDYWYLKEGLFCSCAEAAIFAIQFGYEENVPELLLAVLDQADKLIDEFGE